MSILSRSIAIACNGIVTDSSGVDRAVCNVFTYFTEDVLGAGTVNLFSAAFEDNVWSVVVAALHEDYVGQPYRVYFPARIFAGGGVDRLDGLNGEVTGDRLPLSCAVNMVLRTASRSAHYRGLKRFGPIAEDHVTDDELNATGITAWEAARVAIETPFTDGFSHLWQPIVESRVLTAAVPFPTLVDGEVVTAVQLNKTLGFARHRRERTNR